MKNVTALLAAALVLGAATTTLHAEPFPAYTGAASVPCRPNPDAWIYFRDDYKAKAKALEEEKCRAADALMERWAAEWRKVEEVRQEAETAVNAGRWDTFRATIDEKAKPLVLNFWKEVGEQSLVSGVSQLKANMEAALSTRFHNAGLKAPLTPDEAFATLAQAIDNADQRGAAATAVSTWMLGLHNDVVTFAGLLRMHDQRERANAAVALANQQRQANAARAIAETNADQRPNTTGAQVVDNIGGYVWGFSDRFRAITAVPEAGILAFLAALAGVVFGRAKRAALYRWPLGTMAVALAVWVVNLFLPVLTPYLGALVLGVAGTVLGAVGVLRLGARLDLPNKPALHLGLVVGAGLVSFLVAFALPSFISGSLGALLAGFWLVQAVEKRTLGTLGTIRSKAAAAAGVGLDGLKVADDILHGSAGWGGVEDARKGKHLGGADEPGFALGRLDAVPAGTDDRFRFMGHLVTCAPTGAGKGVGAVIPNLLEYPGSALVVDLKGENYAVTARQREAMGHAVYVVDPFNVTGAASAGCNFLDRLNVNDPDCIARSAALAECLVISSKGENAHFDETARGLLQGIMLHVAGGPADRRHLGEVRRLLTLDLPDFEGVMADMVADPDAAYGVPARAANTLMSTGDRERGSILSTARRSTAFLDDPRIITTASKTDFDFSRLKTELVTVYLVIPPDRMEFYYRYLRVFIGTALSALLETQKKPKYRVAFFIDEFAQLGRMQSIEKAISIVRGYGVVFWLFIQDLSQLKDAYEDKWQTFMANSAKQFFGTDDFDTAEYISKTLGKATVEYATAGTSRKLTELAPSQSENTQFTGRELLTPDEVMRLGSKPIVIVRGEPPYMLERINYLEDPEYEGLFDANPYH